MNKDEKLHNIIARFKLTKKEEKEFTDIIYDIYSHNEFQIRMTDKFYHHGTVTLGEHILEDTLITYKKIKKLKSQKKVDLKLALKIAMMHDLYEEAWQNKRKKFNSFFHLHGFRHPIEAAINSAVWYKDEFKDLETAKKIIDGIIHHMYPFPVTVLKTFDKNDIELKNFNKIELLNDDIKKLIIESTKRKSIGAISISRSKYKEGRIMSTADKLSTLTNLKKISDVTALTTGKNKRLIKKDK